MATTAGRAGSGRDVHGGDEAHPLAPVVEHGQVADEQEDGVGQADSRIMLGARFLLRPAMALLSEWPRAL